MTGEVDLSTKSRKRIHKTIPQVIALAKITKDGRIALRKKVRQYLQLDGKQRLYFFRGREITISTKKSGTGNPIVVEKNGIRLPLSVLERLEVGKGNFVDLVERNGALWWIRNPRELLVSEAVDRYRRIGRVSTAGENTHLLKMRFGIGEGCKIIMTRALTRTKNQKLKKLLNIRLWEFAAMLNLTKERMAGLKHHEVSDRAVLFLQIFSRCDLPVAKLVIKSMLPWLVYTQNRDGSWGHERFKDAASYTVVQALSSLGEHLPSGFFGAERR